MPDWFSLFAAHRVVVVRSEEVVQGILHPGLDGDHPAVREALSNWDGTHFLRQTDEGTEVTLVRRLSPRPREWWGLHLALALGTLLTTTIAGAYFQGRDPLSLSLLPLGPWWVPIPHGLAPAELVPGLAFSIPLLFILFAHEMGHYLVARHHGMDVSPPYFIPAPAWLNLIGTFGAFIRLRSAILNRAVLLDMGMGGPLASFALSVPVTAAGLLGSRVVASPAGQEHPGSLVVVFGDQPIWLGGSLAFDLLARAFAPPGADAVSGGAVLLHPLAFAGWLGLFVTALNLFPLAQLDGGHILYALVGARQRAVGLVFLLVLLVLGNPAWGGWWGWWLWAGLILLLSRGHVRHPAVLDPEFPVTGRRRRLGWLCVGIFFLTFVAVPIRT